MCLSLVLYVWVALTAPPDLRTFWCVIALAVALSTIGRMLLHRIDDAQLAQRAGAWVWTGLFVPTCTAVTCFYLTGHACGMHNLDYFGPLTSFASALVNGSHGLGFAQKLSLVGLMLAVDLVLATVCGEIALALALLLC